MYMFLKERSVIPLFVYSNTLLSMMSAGVYIIIRNDGCVRATVDSQLCVDCSVLFELHL
jgi:hypothetical protein